MSKRLFSSLGLTVLSAALLTGCATGWVVDSEVRSHSALQSFTPGASYRFERLPSQSATEQARQTQSTLESMAAPALAAVGLHAPAEGGPAPRYTVQLSARVHRVRSPAEQLWAPDPWRHAWTRPWHAPWGWHGGRWGHPDSYHLGPAPQPWYMREVSVVLRELPNHTVVYESSARHDGPYNLTPHILPVLFRAALQGFPTPPASPRQVDITLGQPEAPPKVSPLPPDSP